MNQQLKEVKSALSDLKPKCGNTIVISIDGPAGSGKTTLAKELESQLDSVYTIHMDDLYEGWSSTLSQKLTAKLLNILERIKSQDHVIFSPFDWVTQNSKEEVKVLAPEYLIIEGVGSGQSAIRSHVSLALWIEVPQDEGLARVIARDGLAVADYMPAFLVAQNIHFQEEHTKKSADFHLSGLGTV